MDGIKYDEKGLVPAIVQEYNTKKVLMLAYMNEESIKKTIMTGETWFFSRSRQELWNKGATSGNKQYVKRMHYDCDGDAILIEAIQEGEGACHTGNYSCFFNDLYTKSEKDEMNPDIISKVVETIQDRKIHPVEGSYTKYLFDKGIDKVLKKVGEESAEVIIAAKNTDNTELVYEISDLVYHVLVLMEIKGVSTDEIKAELTKRYNK